MISATLFSLLLGTALADTPLSELPVAYHPAFETAEAHWAAGRLQRAEAAYRQVVEGVPEFDRSWRRLCGVVLAQGRIREAVQACRKAVELKPSAENHIGLGIALTQMPAKRDEAAALLAQATEAAPELLPGWQATCALLHAQGRDKQLETCARRMEALDPLTPGTLFYGALYAIATDNLALAQRLLLEARSRGLPDSQFQEANQRLVAASPTQAPRRRRPQASWQASDLLPVGLAGVLILTVVLLAFGADPEEPEEAELPEEPELPEAPEEPEEPA